ncbi:MAG TPA: type III secretion system chaperone [Herbaspirillum sp.]|jgi:hypothetical protein
MHISSDFSPWSGYLRRHGNDASLLFDEEGTLSLLVDRHKVDCRVVTGSMIVSARICDTPANNAERRMHLCRVLTLVNRHAHHRREFPVLNEQRTLQLQAWMHSNMTYEAFSLQFDQFMEALDAWREATLPSGSVITRMPEHIGDRPFRRSSHKTSAGFL